MSGYKEIQKIKEMRKQKKEMSQSKRLSEFIQKRKRNPAATMREIRIKRAKALGISPSQIGIKEEK